VTGGLSRFSIGMGDRFGRQGIAQLSAVVEASMLGVGVVPVWNKSFREHSIIGTVPSDVRLEADAAVRALGWKGKYFVDADHIGMKNVGHFTEDCDFFTIDVADSIGKSADGKDLARFEASGAGLVGKHVLGDGAGLAVDADQVSAAGRKYLSAVMEAGVVYRRVRDVKAGAGFVVEVSMDETDVPQSPVELLCILKMIADQGIPADTVAPRFCGRFNKGVDYGGDVKLFESEFRMNLLVLAYARKRFGLKDSLKLSMHSGSDKFSIYPIVAGLLEKYGEGLHLKTAGTTWLEEVSGLAGSGGDGLALARTIYGEALARYDEMVKPYASVVEIDRAELPAAADVASWDSATFISALGHEPGKPLNRSFRQMLHVSFRIAAEKGRAYTDALDRNAAAVSARVKDNLLRKHIMPLFGKSKGSAD
jgi:hypothetical protein